ncbi:response regulator transcription factor [Prauserella cavernicola]|uniref:Helix-turn-helix transcriptional regulator n=1 Tax=Prauserella cavernicola TaxID=2800127 RepID=A0A934QXI3_9PSEU|nr:helix-turn-helix transcriptional regulator [Prauserella cavernicola]MBK1787967.1 helix-turn-helix transcriptional regulator [Prauserella cavernicola]
MLVEDHPVVLRGLRVLTVEQSGTHSGVELCPSLKSELAARGDREHTILRQILEGRSNPDFAHRLSIEITTVKTHVRNILRKFGVDTRRDLLSPHAAQRSH